MQYEGHHLRHELKYYINYSVYHTLRNRLKIMLAPDKNMDREEGYLITSLYFDDMHHSAVEDKVSGVRFRKKFRIRCYERYDRFIRLECKSKFDEYISKTSAMLNREEYHQIISGNYDFLINREETVCKELFCYHKIHLLKPVVAVEYEREAYLAKEGNVRITFDKDIAASFSELDMFAPGFITTKVLPDSWMVLEVKFDSYLPKHIQSVLRTAMTEKCAISKYVMCRNKNRMVGYR